MEAMELFAPREEGPIGSTEAAERAAALADSPGLVRIDTDVRIIETTWRDAADLLAVLPQSEPRLGESSVVVVALVTAPVTNTDVPPDAEIERYDRYMVVYEKLSAWGFTLCMGCPPGQVGQAPTTTTEHKDQ